MSRNRSKRWGRIVLLFGVLALGLPSAAGAAGEEPKVVGRIPVVAPADADPSYTVNGSLIVVPETRRAYQLYQLRTLEMIIRSFDLDTLQQIGERRHRVSLQPALSTASGEFIHAVDPDTGRIFLPYVQAGNFGGLAVIDGETLDVTTRFTKDAAPAAPGTEECDVSTSLNCVPLPVGVVPTIRGLSFVPSEVSGGRAKLLLLFNEPTAPGAERNQNLVWVSQWDAGSGKQDFLYRVAACSNFMLPSDPLTRYQIALFQSPNGAGIYVGCNAPGGAGQAVRLLPDSTGRPVAEEAYPGPLRVVDILSDPQSDRLIFRSVSEEGESYWVFDGRSSSYAGVIGSTVSSAATGAGVDPTTGRLYMLTPPTTGGNQREAGGLLLADIRRSPVPQALKFAKFAANGQYAIGVDPEEHGVRGRRVFTRAIGAEEWLVIADPVPISSDPRASDLDRFTTDVVEEEGKTAANFTGTAGSYGVRALYVGGLEGVPTQTADAAGFRPGRALPTWLGSPCGRTDRELVLAGVRKSALSNDLASATSTAVDADSGTKTDELQPVGRCWPRPAPIGVGIPERLPVYPEPPAALDEAHQSAQKTAFGQEGEKADWPYPVTECSGNDEQANRTLLMPEQSAAASDQLPEYSSTARCRQSSDEVISSAAARQVDLGPVILGDVSTTVRLYRDKLRGLVVRSEARVSGIEVYGQDAEEPVIKIEAARTVAESFAAGRNGTAGTTFERVLCGVHIETADGPVDVSPCLPPDSMVTPTLEQQFGKPPLIQAMNRALGSRGRVLIPSPDPELRQGTPGGYLASVQKDRLQQVSANSVNNDPSSQVAALEIVIFNDDPTAGRGRQIYQLAGVDASTTYGINVLDALLDMSDGDLTDLPLTDLLLEMTGGSSGADGSVLGAYGAAAPQQGAPGFLGATPGGAAVMAVYKGAKFFLRNPREAALAGSVWFLLLFPGMLVIRRRLLLGSRVT